MTRGKAASEPPARIDALAGDNDERFVVLTGDHLDTTPDPELSRIVGEIAERMHVPMSMVSLVLKRAQYFRAQTGLGAGMDHVRSTARDASFCQFVVRDAAMLEVSDAKDDPSVPQELVRRFGHRAYLGVPIRTGGKVVGSLCAVDTAPREFTDADRALLEDCALRASRRLDEMAATADNAAVVSPAIEPAFAELRNAMAPLFLNLSRAQVAAAELGGLVRAIEAAPPSVQSAVPGLSTLPDPRKVERDLVAGLGAMASASARMRRVIQALELAILAEREPATVGEIVDAAAELSRHGTKLVGGLQDQVDGRDRLVGVPRQWAIVSLTAAISLVVEALLSAKTSGGIELAWVRGAATPTLRVRGAGLGDRSLGAAGDPLFESVGRHGLVADASPGGLVVELPLAAPPAAGPQDGHLPSL